MSSDLDDDPRWVHQIAMPARDGFVWHLAIYIIVNALLVLTWWYFGGGLFWPIFLIPPVWWITDPGLWRRLGKSLPSGVSDHGHADRRGDENILKEKQ